MNDTVVSINRGKSKDQYPEPANPKFIADDAYLLLGVMLTVVFPQLTYIKYGGPVPPIVFAGCALVGFIWGLVMRYKTPDKTTLSYVRTGTTQKKAQPSKDTNQKKAA